VIEISENAEQEIDAGNSAFERIRRGFKRGLSGSTRLVTVVKNNANRCGLAGVSSAVELRAHYFRLMEIVPESDLDCDDVTNSQFEGLSPCILGSCSTAIRSFHRGDFSCVSLEISACKCRESSETRLACTVENSNAVDERRPVLIGSFTSGRTGGRSDDEAVICGRGWIAPGRYNWQSHLSGSASDICSVLEWDREWSFVGLPHGWKDGTREYLEC